MSNSPSTQIVPGNIMKLLSGENKIANVEAIINYLTSEPGTIELTQLQKDLLARFDFADNLMRQRIYSDAMIVRLMCKKWAYSPASARRDLADAQHVYGSNRSKNKMYLLTNHIDRMEQALILLQKQGRWKEWAVLTGMLTKAISMMPDSSKERTQAAAIIFNFNGESGLMDATMDRDKAAAVAKEIFAEDIEYEDLKDLD